MFDTARVPHANVVGEVNAGARMRGADRSEFGDLELAANALGVCDAAVEHAMACARTQIRRGWSRLAVRISEPQRWRL